jgi:outer membrane immunogenic protein
LKKLLQSSSALLVLASALALAHGQALAASPDDLDREKAQLRKENTDLRELLRMRDENAALRQRLGNGVEVHAMRAQPPVRLAPAVRESYAADMPLYKTGPAPSAVYNWTGFYFGGNIGYSVGSDRTRGVLTTPALSEVSGVDSAVAPVGAIGGGQLGYNWQGGPNWLVGFEADFQGSGQKAITCVLACETINQGVFLDTSTVQHRLDYFGTVRGRIGMVSNNALFYVTGGGAYGRVNQTIALTTLTGGAGSFDTASTMENKFGFVVGAGVEAALGGNWTGKIEYLYMDLGSTGTSLPTVIPPGTPVTFAASSNIHDNIIRAGLNYHLGPQSASLSAYDAMAAVPVSAAPSLRSWTGFYVGGNVGYGFGNNPVTQSEAAIGFVATSEPNGSVTPKGVVGGVQLGYNWQGGRNWLVGFEADLQGTAQTDTVCSPLVCFNVPSSGTNTVAIKQQLDYFGTVRGRLGAIKDNVVYYVTGGAAFAHVSQTVDVNSTTSTPAVFANSGKTADMIGWVVGGGIEAALWGNWTAKGEYLYMDLGSISQSTNASAGANTVILATSSVIRDHIVRIGANYHFE